MWRVKGMENPDGVGREPRDFFSNNNNSNSEEQEEKWKFGHDMDHGHSESNEQTNTWALGSIIKGHSYREDFGRLTKLPNRITQEETKFNERLIANNRTASILTEFFPFKWLLEITSTFRKMDAKKLGVKTPRDRSLSYLGFVEIYLTSRGLTILNTSLEEINESLEIDPPLTKNEIRNWKLKIIHLVPELREKWIRHRKQAHHLAIMSTVVQVMNHELDLTAYSKEQIFEIKQTALLTARKFVLNPKSRHIKKPEVWARVICLKAFKNEIGGQGEVNFKCQTKVFPS